MNQGSFGHHPTFSGPAWILPSGKWVGTTVNTAKDQQKRGEGPGWGKKLWGKRKMKTPHGSMTGTGGTKKPSSKIQEEKKGKREGQWIRGLLESGSPRSVKKSHEKGGYVCMGRSTVQVGGEELGGGVDYHLGYQARKKKGGTRDSSPGS